MSSPGDAEIIDLNYRKINKIHLTFDGHKGQSCIKCSTLADIKASLHLSKYFNVIDIFSKSAIKATA